MNISIKRIFFSKFRNKTNSDLRHNQVKNPIRTTRQGEGMVCGKKPA